MRRIQTRHFATNSILLSLSLSFSTVSLTFNLARAIRTTLARLHYYCWVGNSWQSCGYFASVVAIWSGTKTGHVLKKVNNRGNDCTITEGKMPALYLRTFDLTNHALYTLSKYFRFKRFSAFKIHQGLKYWHNLKKHNQKLWRALLAYSFFCAVHSGLAIK